MRRIEVFVTNYAGRVSLGQIPFPHDGGYARFWASYRARPGDHFAYTQVGQSLVKTNGIVVVDTGTNYWLDAVPFRTKPGCLSPADENGIGVVQQADAPWSTLVQTEMERTDRFKTYFQYKPEPWDSSIPITLNRVDWSWGFDAQYTNGEWLVTPRGISAPSWHEDNSFPIWTGTLPEQVQ